MFFYEENSLSFTNEDNIILPYFKEFGLDDVDEEGIGTIEEKLDELDSLNSDYISTFFGKYIDDLESDLNSRKEELENFREFNEDIIEPDFDIDGGGNNELDEIDNIFDR